MSPPKVPDWWAADDPWLTTRMRHMAQIAAGEQEVGLAVEKAIASFLDAARAGMLDHDKPDPPAPPGRALTADADMPPDPAGWPDVSIWRAALEAFLFPVLGGLFGERFRAEVRRAVIADEPWRLEYIQTVWDRLVLWPKTAWEEQIQPELAEGIAEGEDHRQLRERVGEALSINARSRRLQAEIGALTKTIENPETPAQLRREARSRRSALYRSKEREDRRWWFYAARIARTEVLGALNAGTFHGAVAYNQHTGEERWKQWWATSDTRVRNSHWAAHMQVQPLTEKFRVGGRGLDHPGDPNGPGHEVINCRCSLLTMGRAEAEREQQRYEAMAPDRTDIHGRPLDEDGQPVTASADIPEGIMTNTVAGQGITGHTATAVTAAPNAPAPAPPGGEGLPMVNDRVRLPDDRTGTITDVDYEDNDARVRLDDTGEIIRVALDALTVTEPAQGAAGQGLTWRGILAPLGVRSGDYRRIDAPADHALRTRDLPLPLLYQEKLSSGHSNAIQGLANITRAAILTGHEASALGLAPADQDLPADALFLVGEGEFDGADPDAVTLARKVERGFTRWVSVDLDDVAETAWHRYRGEEDLGPIDFDEADLELLLGFASAPHAERVQRVRTLAVERCGLDDSMDEVVEVVRSWRLMGATLVSQPAFHEAHIRVMPVDDAVDETTPPEEYSSASSENAVVDAGVDTPPPDGPATAENPAARAGVLVAAVIGDTSLPIAARERRWDGSGAKTRVREWATGSGGEVDTGKISKAFLWRDPDADATTVGAYKFPFADVIDGTLTIIPAGVFAAASRLESGDIPASDKDSMRGKLSTLYGKLRAKFDDDSIQPPWKAALDMSRTLTPAALIAAARPLTAAARRERTSWAHHVAETAHELFEPPAWMFDDPQLTGPTPLTITPEGHVYGHVHDWTTAHISYGSRRPVRAPRSRSGYAGFNLKNVLCADGSKIKCGALVLGTDHPSTERGITPHQAGAHYDHTGHRVARIRVGPDAHGTWFSGALVPNVTPEQVLEMSELNVSGDWREGELVAALVVNVPGLPIIEGDDPDEPVALVAAGMILRTAPMPMTSMQITPDDLRAALESSPLAIAREVVALMRGEQDRERQMKTLAAQVYSGKVATLDQQIYGRA